jgi:plasmid stabilization system protein ParE
LSYSLHTDAERDIADALAFYRQQAGLAVATKFLDEFERVAALLVEFPAIGTLTTKGRRSFPMRIYPYSVVYRPTDDGIRILIVRHQRRRPKYAEQRR